MKRETGYYWVKKQIDYSWIIGSFIEGMWRFIGDESWYRDCQLAEIDENRIVRNEASYETD